VGFVGIANGGVEIIAAEEVVVDVPPLPPLKQPSTVDRPQQLLFYLEPCLASTA
jgi:hypothetical protein